MKRLCAILLICLPALAACNKKDDPIVEKEKFFSLNGIGFPTLQDAVNAVADVAPDGVATITLTKDATGSGATVPNGKELDIEIDLGGHTYRLNDGCSIDAANNSLTITGSGGSIVASSSEPVICVSKGTLVTLRGKFNISADNFLQAGSPVIITDDFTGSIKGDVTLDEAPVMIYSPNCRIDVPILTAEGESAAFSVDILNGKNSTDPVATIGQVISDQNFPVASSSPEDVVVNFGTCHVHKFQQQSFKGSCIISGVEYLQCSECGYIKASDFSETGYEKCDPAILIRHEKEDPEAGKFGSMEYYECPLCGRQYLDNQGTQEATGGITLVPTDFDKLEALFEVPKTPWYDIASSVFTNALTIAFFIPSLISQLQTQKLFEQIVDRLKVISSKLDDINSRINTLLNEVELMPYKLKMTDRASRLNQLQVQTISTMIAMDSVARKRPDLTAKQKDSIISRILVDWSGTMSAGTALHPQEEIFSLMKEGTTNSTGPNIPQMYTEIVASQPNILWAHESRELAKALLSYEAVMISSIYICAQYYNDSLRTFSSKAAKKAYMNMLTETFREYSNANLDEFKRIAKEDSLYRRYMPANVTYHKEMDTTYDPYGYFGGRSGNCYFPRGNDNYDAEKYGFEVMNFSRDSTTKYGRDTRCLSFMDESVAKDLWKKYNAIAKARGEKKETSAYQILKNAGFTGYPENNWKFILDRNRSWGQDNPGDYEHVHCWIFYWRSYRGSYGHDWFGIRTVMKDNGSTEDVKIIKSCNIEVPGGKMTKINRDDKYKNYKYSTVVVAGKGDQVKAK